MKKVLLILTVILTLTLFIIPVSADDIKDDGSKSYYFEELETGLYVVYEDYTSGVIIDYVITYEFYATLTYKWSEYVGSQEASEGTDFTVYLLAQGWSFLNSNSDLIGLVSIFEAAMLSQDIDAYFDVYKYECNSNDIEVSSSGFEEYLRVKNISLYNHYINGSHSVMSEIYTAGASSSNSSSGGSSGSTMPGEQGEHYGQSHTNTNHNVGDTDCCYNPGYNDGVLDGGDIFQQSEEYQTIINQEKTEAVENYVQSEEYLTFIENVKIQSSETAIQNYLTGDEYLSTKDSCFAAGSEAGYTNAYSDLCSEVYYRGVADGHSSFRGSNEHIADMDSSYRMGYDDGVENERKNAVNPAAVISLIIILFVLLVVLISLFQIKKKKRR